MKYSVGFSLHNEYVMEVIDLQIQHWEASIRGLERQLSDAEYNLRLLYVRKETLETELPMDAEINPDYGLVDMPDDDKIDQDALIEAKYGVSPDQLQSIADWWVR